MYTYKGFEVILAARLVAGSDIVQDWTAIVRLSGIKVAHAEGQTEGEVRYKVHEIIDELRPGIEANGKATQFSRS